MNYLLWVHQDLNIEERISMVGFDDDLIQIMVGSLATIETPNHPSYWDGRHW